MKHDGFVRTAATAMILTSTAGAGDRETVILQVNQTTVFGQSVFVLGDLPELGGNDLRFAVKLEPSQYPLWKAPISLPAGADFTYRYYIRSDAAGAWGNVANGTPISAILNGSTSPDPGAPGGKTVWLHSTISPPVLRWRQGSGAWQSIPMHDTGPGRSVGERRWAARRFGTPGLGFEFYFTDEQGGQRNPPTGSYTNTLDRQLVQDAQVFTYPPAPSVSPLAKDYSPANPPSIVSTALGGELRRYRVVLPRGYTQHTDRSYPVLYLHDGQNVFDTGPFGTWNAHTAAQNAANAGLMREAILVGIDNTANRLTNYKAPDDDGGAADYVAFIRDELKPLIDATYRTLPGPEHTGAMGSSLGGVVSLYMGWDHTDVFTRIGALSGSWQFEGFPNRVRSQPKRAIRLYLDSGDAGTASDNFWRTVSLRDNLIDPARAGGVLGPYALHDDLLHTYGPGQQHNEAAWAARVPGALRYLFPASEDDGLAGVPSAQPADVNDDDLISIEDLYAWENADPGPGSTLDVDRDTAIDPAADRAALLGLLRADEAADTSPGG